MRNIKPKYITKDQDSRLYGLAKPLIALTGGIATGKSTVSQMIRSRGLKIIDADQLVKKIYEKEVAQNFIRNSFPSAWKDNSIDFKELRQLFFQHEDVKKRIETFIYQYLPEVFSEEAAAIHDQNFYFYDVPLLFEKKLEQLVDISVVVYAPQEVQLMRLMKRDGCSEETARKILSHQMNIEEKKSKSDFIIHNNGSISELDSEIENFLIEIFA